jgi:hypothetical protein
MSDQIKEALVCALAALESCCKDGYEDVDGDWVTTYHYDTLKVAKAKDAVRAALEAA